MATLIVLIVAGLVLLVVGAEQLVQGAARLAATAGISPLVIGLTVVAFGTSAPEASISVMAALQGTADLALGNVVGSNIFNVLLILGLSAMITPLVVTAQLVRLDVPLMIAASLLVAILALDGALARVEGALLVGLLLSYVGLLLGLSRRASRKVQAEFAQEYGDAPAGEPRRPLIDGGRLLVGLAGLVIGSRWLVSGAGQIASALGISELVIGLTIVAAGTSLPEVATSVVASLRGEREIAVGNVVGSNLFNLLGVLGVAALAAPVAIPVPATLLGFDLPVMIAVAVACLPIFVTGNLIARWEGAVFFLYYLAYTAALLLRAGGQGRSSTLGEALIWFVVPLTLLTVVVILVEGVRDGWLRPRGRAP